MGYEVTYKFHQRKEDGGYSTQSVDEKTVKIGKAFDDVSLEKLAASIMSELARRDIWVVDVKISEFVRREVSFKEAKDGRGILLKNRKFSLNSTAQLVEEESSVELLDEQPVFVEEVPLNIPKMAPRPLAVSKNIDQKKPLYWVYFEPYIHLAEAKQLGLNFDYPEEGSDHTSRKYPVHAIVPSPTGRLDAQKIVVSDNDGRQVAVDEKFFSTVGTGLYGDKELGFSRKSNGERSKLLYDDVSPDTSGMPVLRRG